MQYKPFTTENQTQYLLDIGAFFDRFGPAKLAILTSQDQVVKALVTDLQTRHWVDLKRDDVRIAVQYMRGVDVPMLGTIATPIAGITEELENNIFDTPAEPSENMVLVKSYFS